MIDEKKNWTLPGWTPYITSTNTRTSTVRGVTGNGNLSVW
jgi:hypothetical protein